jgi:hypothetical protein
MHKEHAASFEVIFDCCGRTSCGQAALTKPIEVTATVSKLRGTDVITCSVDRCSFNTGSHGQRCRASHPGHEKLGDGVLCPFAFDYPCVQEADPDWQPPTEVADFFRAIRGF